MTLQSHHDPHRKLQQHVAEVFAATEAILALHDADVRDRLRTEVERAVRLHDAGKASAAFQAYIRDPDAWRGAPAEKAHTPLSFVVAMATAREHAWSAEAAIRVGMAVRGHHGGLPSSASALQASFDDDRTFAALLAQMPTVDEEALVGAIKYALAPLPRTEADLFDLADWVEDAVAAWPAALDEAVPGWVALRAVWSVLLEADKVFLAVENPRAWLHRSRPTLPEPQHVDAACAALVPTPLSALRDRAREAARDGFEHVRGPFLTLTLPTGAGKTLIAARWALSQRGDLARPRTVILALPMLSIVDQTERVWRRLLGDPEGPTLIASHSVADRVYLDDVEQGERDFLLDSWTTEVVVTTFDQLLLALFSGRARHGLRFHRLLDAVIVLDEVQAIPTALWIPVAEGLRALTQTSSTRVLAMSATPTGMLRDAEEVLADPQALYQSLQRYRIEVDVGADRDLERFASDVRAVRQGATLVTVNTRRTAQLLWESLCDDQPLLLSGDLTPHHRLEVIRRLGNRGDVLVVATQCVEAGVDIDMDVVVRDMAPLDSIVQVAGRCNRHAHREVPDRVLVWSLVRDGRRDADVVYNRDGNDIQLQETRRVLRGRAEIQESEVLDLCRAYFSAVASRVAQGAGIWERMVRLEDTPDIQRMFRGDAREDLDPVLVVEQDATLEGDLRSALAVGDRWARRTALRGLAGRVARVTVQAPREVWRTRSCGPFLLLEPGQYHPVRGLTTT